MIDRAIFRVSILSGLTGVLSVVIVSGAFAAQLLVPQDFSTIQAAIDAAAVGDEVIVSSGSYSENLVLKSGVGVRGVEAARTLLRPAETNVAAVSANLVNDVLLRNLTLVDAQVGVDVIDSTVIRISNLVIDSASQFGIRVNAGSQAEILNSVFWRNAVAISRATIDVQITNNAFSGNTVTITSPIGGLIDPNINVDNCGFFANDDLVVAGVGTGLGANPIVADPQFVATADRDFHLRLGSAFIDSGVGQDVIDNTTADIGVYGGQFADAIPFPLSAPAVSDVSGASPPPYNAELAWQANFAYLITNTTNSGTYRVYYQQNQVGPPYSGTDAGNGTLPSPVEAGEQTTLTLPDLQPSAPAPAAPQLLTAEARDDSVALTWTAVDTAGDYRVHWGVDSADENQVDAGNVTAYTVAGLVNGTTYRFTVSALRQSVYHFSVTALDNTQNRNESDYSPESTLAIGPLFEGAQSNELSTAPAVTVPYPDLPDKGCFVATAAFGADWFAEVLALRDFRDRFLMTNRPGRRFVAWYYAYGPSAARYIDERAILKPIVRILLLPLVVFALLMLGATWPALTAASALAAALIARRTMPKVKCLARRVRR
jgi:hypothetical protein